MALFSTIGFDPTDPGAVSRAKYWLEREYSATGKKADPTKDAALAQAQKEIAGYSALVDALREALTLENPYHPLAASREKRQEVFDKAYKEA